MPELNEPKKVVDSAAVIRECEDIEGEIAALRAAYEQYFLGMEKRPPTTQHKALTKRLQLVRNAWTRQTAAKFRVQTLSQKFATYERLWSKTIMEIENGTYIRDVQRLRRKHKNPAPESRAKEQKPAAEKDELVIDDVLPLDEGGPESLADAMAKAAAHISAPKAAAPPVAPAVAALPKVAAVTTTLPPLGVPPVVPPAAAARPLPPGMSAGKPLVPGVAPVSGPRAAVAPGVAPVAGVSGAARPATAPPAVARPAASSATPARAAAPSGAPPSQSGAPLGDEKLRAVYDAFVKAKKRCNEDTSAMSYEQVATSLRKQVPELMKQHNAKGVEFKVVIKDGKAILRAVPKEG